MKKFFILLVLSVGSLLHADVIVTSMTAQQRYPWNDKVDIVVTLQGPSNDVFVTKCIFVATNTLTGTALNVEHIERVGKDTGVGNVWTRRFIWNVTADVGEVKIDDVALTVETGPDGVQLWKDGPYWAECNVGASRPEEYGYYFGWGDTVGYKRNADDNGWVSVKDGTSFTFSPNFLTMEKDITTLQSLGYIDSTGNLAAEYDAATVHLGTPWRMPTYSEIITLKANCTTMWTTRNGVYGRLVMGKDDYASKSIFLPAVGSSTYGSDLIRTGYSGEFWTSTPYLDYSDYACCFEIDSNSLSTGDHQWRYIGFPVRPLREFAQYLSTSASVTAHLKVDGRTGTRVPSLDGEVLYYDASWYENGDEIRLTDNGNIVATGATGSCIWYPKNECSVNDLKLEILSKGEVIATETAQLALGYIRNATVRQLWPHNKVEVCYDLAVDINKVADEDTALQLSTCQYENDATYPWSVDTNNYHTGGSAWKSGNSGQANSSSSLSVTVRGVSKVSFYWKVASESDCDKLHFYVDDSEVVWAISGSVDWCHVVYDLTSTSEHTLTWSYTKDGSIDTSSDCGWVDDVTMETEARTFYGDTKCIPGAHRVVWDLEADGVASLNSTIKTVPIAYATASTAVTGCMMNAVYDGMNVGSQIELAYSPINESSVSLEVNGRTLVTSAESGTYKWVPERPGTYVLTHRAGTNVFTRCVVCTNGTDMSQLEIGWLDTSISNLFPNIYASVTNVVILPAVWPLSTDVFAGCTGLGANEPGLWILENWVLGYIGEVPASLTIPEGVVGIAEHAFEGVSELESVSLPKTLKYIGDRAFAGCTALAELRLPNGVEMVGEEAFRDCTWIQAIKFPSTLSTIGKLAFANCAMLEGIDCPDGLKTIGEGAFSNCWRMVSVSLPVSVDEIGDRAFYNCKNLTGVTIPTHVKTVAQLFPSAYRTITSLTIAEGETCLKKSIFSGCTGIEGVVLNDEITEIPNYAFSGCTNLLTVSFPAHLTHIGINAFAQCSKIEVLPFNEGLETIGNGAFKGLTRVAGLDFPTSLRSIGASAFSGLAALTDIDIPAGVTNIGVTAFSNCANLRRATVSATVTETPTGLFENCSALCEVTLPSSVMKIGARCFKNCTALTESCIPSHATELASEAFSGCSCLVTIALPSGLATIGDSAFAKCTSFSSIVMPATLATLGANVFDGCTSLKSVSYLGSCPTFNASCYAGTPSDLQSYVVMGSCGWDGIATSKTLPETWPTSYARAIAYWTPNTFTATFDGNGGTPASTSIVQTTGLTYQLPTNEPTRRGAQFAGWWTEKLNGGEITFTTKAEVALGQTFYAHWRYHTYTVSFDANGGSGTMDDVGMTVDTAVALPMNAFSRRDYAFAGWALKSNGAVAYADGAVVSNLTYEADARIVLYAVWEKRQWTAAEYLNSSGRTFAFEGDAVWTPDSKTSHDGVGSVRSGVIGAADDMGERTTSTMSTTIRGKGTGSFWWKVDCEPPDEEYGDYFDYVVFTIDGEEVAKLAGTTGWTNITYTITTGGEHELAWTFTRDDWDEEGAEYENAAWVDEFVWTPATVLVTFDAGGATGDVPSAQSLKAGDVLVMPNAGGLVYDEKTFVGWSDGENIHKPGEALTLEGDDITLTAVWKLIVWTLEVAANVTNLSLSTGGDAVWSIDQTVSHDGEASLKSGTVGTSQTTWVETQVNGSGTLSFWWKSEGYTYRGSAANFVQCLVDDVSVAKVTTCDWTNLCVTVSGAGTHTIRWSYTHKRTQSSGADAAWLDQIEWVGDNSDPLPELTNPTSEEVKNILTAAIDSRVASNITNKTGYASFRTWANQVKVQDGTALAGPSNVMASPHAWLSYALDSATLLTTAPQQGDMTIAVFAKGAAAGAYDFQISIEGITVGTGTDPANLATIFSLEGCSTVNGNYQPLAVTFGTPVDGKVTVTAQPTGTSFFIKAKMKP